MKKFCRDIITMLAIGIRNEEKGRKLWVAFINKIKYKEKIYGII